MNKKTVKDIDVNGKKIIALSPFYRAILVFFLVSIFMFIMLFSEEIITKILVMRKVFKDYLVKIA